MLGERLQENAPRYNLTFKESGSMILLWLVPGILILVGPFISLYIIIKNTNALAEKNNIGAKQPA
jgi:cytochrome c-type biogenesis protein CcmH/NrfF